MFRFETEDIQLDFIELLSSFGIPLADYQKLELLFRQIMIQSPAIQASYSCYEPEIDLVSPDLSPTIIAELEAWHARYPDQAYGLGPVAIDVIEGRAKARSLYRKALATFAQMSDVNALTDRWLNELYSKLRFHISQNADVESAPADDFVFYLAAAELIYRPYFEMRFENRQHTSEKFHEFLSLKLTMELGRPPDFEKLMAASVSVTEAVRDLERYVHLPTDWVERIDDSFRNIQAA